MLEINGWNINPNRRWFVRLVAGASDILAELYLTQADAEAQANRQASGRTTGFGSGMPVALENDPGATHPVSFFQGAYSWHLKVSGQSGDPATIYRVAEFVELEEISHPIYRNSRLISTRATAEIDAHTHATVRTELDLGSHLPALEPGDVLRLNSSRRGKDENRQVFEHRISGEIGGDGEAKLTSTVIVASYIELRR